MTFSGLNILISETNLRVSKTPVPGDPRAERVVDEPSEKNGLSGPALPVDRDGGVQWNLRRFPGNKLVLFHGNHLESLVHPFRFQRAVRPVVRQFLIVIFVGGKLLGLFFIFLDGKFLLFFSLPLNHLLLLLRLNSDFSSSSEDGGKPGNRSLET